MKLFGFARRGKSFPARAYFFAATVEKIPCSDAQGIRVQAPELTRLFRREPGCFARNRDFTLQIRCWQGMRPNLTAKTANGDGPGFRGVRRRIQDRIGDDLALLAQQVPEVSGGFRRRGVSVGRAGLAGGESGIRTHETVARLHAFQACAFDHSATSPSAGPGYLHASRPGASVGGL